MSKIIIAPNAFKNALSADLVAEAIHQGLVKGGVQSECVLFPVGDGGDGTGTLLTNALGGETLFAEVHDPLGRKITSSFGFIRDRKIAVIEMAAASGLRLLKENERDPLRATSDGTGELIFRALGLDARKIVLAVGGSATVDGGCGLLRALGFEFRDRDNKVIANLPGDLDKLHWIDVARIPGQLKHCEIIVLCDVKNPLLGSQGAIPVFAPQKGATNEMMVVLQKGFQRLAEVIGLQTGIDVSSLVHGGAAGGVAAILRAYLNAKLVSGIDYFLEVTDFRHVVRGAGLIITGEGSLDEQTVEGKAPYGVALAASEHNIPVIALAGKADVNERLSQIFSSIRIINREPLDPAEAIARTFTNLVDTAEALGKEIASGR